MRITNTPHSWILAVMLLAAQAAVGGARAGPWEDGLAAYDTGNFFLAQTLWLPLAEQGNGMAQYNLGIMFQRGQGVAKDDNQAAYWFRQVAEQGVDRAEFNLAEMYKKGQGVAKDDAQAFHWYKLAADRGHVRAQYQVGLAYGFGEGVAEDAEQAAIWYRLAAEQGHVYAQYNLGASYNIGAGVPKDTMQAFLWMSLAAEQGDWDAKQFRNALAGMLTPEDLEEAQAMALGMWEKFVFPFLQVGAPE